MFVATRCLAAGVVCMFVPGGPLVAPGRIRVFANDVVLGVPATRCLIAVACAFALAPGGPVFAPARSALDVVMVVPAMRGEVVAATRCAVACVFAPWGLVFGAERRAPDPWVLAARIRVFTGATLVPLLQEVVMVVD